MDIMEMIENSENRYAYLGNEIYVKEPGQDGYTISLNKPLKRLFMLNALRTRPELKDPFENIFEYLSYMNEAFISRCIFFDLRVDSFFPPEEEEGLSLELFMGIASVCDLLNSLKNCVDEHFEQMEELIIELEEGDGETA